MFGYPSKYWSACFTNKDLGRDPSSSSITPPTNHIIIYTFSVAGVPTLSVLPYWTVSSKVLEVYECICVTRIKYKAVTKENYLQCCDKN